MPLAKSHYPITLQFFIIWALYLVDDTLSYTYGRSEAPYIAVVGLIHNVTYGGESASARSRDRLQNGVLLKAKWLPKKLRTDSLSARIKSTGTIEALTARL